MKKMTFYAFRIYVFTKHLAENVRHTREVAMGPIKPTDEMIQRSKKLAIEGFDKNYPGFKPEEKCVEIVVYSGKL